LSDDNNCFVNIQFFEKSKIKEFGEEVSQILSNTKLDGLELDEMEVDEMEVDENRPEDEKKKEEKMDNKTKKKIINCLQKVWYCFRGPAGDFVSLQKGWALSGILAGEKEEMDYNRTLEKSET